MLYFMTLRNKGVYFLEGFPFVKKVCCSLLGVVLIALLSACGSEVITTSSLSSYSIVNQNDAQQTPTATSMPLSVPAQKVTPAPTTAPHTVATSTATSTPAS